MDYGLEGKVALVTGTASQIGQGKRIALTLAKEGCDIICNDIDLDVYEHGAETTASEVRALGRKAIAVAADVAYSSQVDKMVEIALKEFGRIDILINNAGGESGMEMPGTDEERWDRMMDVNLKGAVNCMNAVLPGMIAQKSGKICTTSSHAGILGPPAMPYKSGYGVAKVALQGLTRQVAMEVGPKGINVNAIIPGWVITNLTLKDIPNPLAFYNVNPKEIPNDQSVAEMAETMAARIPSRRINTVQDIANLVTFLVSDVSRQIMGQTIFIDGGWHMA
ncbi:MAG: SDR family oxidoreductase [Dehalococcoidales bacterium]|nr:SDR family oxidoreductase [Dehalococcoidales bacterium]